MRGALSTFLRRTAGKADMLPPHGTRGFVELHFQPRSAGSDPMVQGVQELEHDPWGLRALLSPLSTWHQDHK